MSGSRQQPGLACEECRKKKLRCDRRRPQCDQCEESGTACLVNQIRSPRGPKKGHLKALRNRIATLESIINCEQADTGARSSSDRNEQYQSDETMHSLTPPQGYRAIATSIIGTSPLSTTTPITPPHDQISDIIEADLNQLYFDRVHPVIPMLHQGRYFSWSQRSDKPSSHISLQFAMWALAAASSAHLQHLRESLYTRARSGIEALDYEIEPANAACLQTAQTWLLLTHYEFRYMSYKRAWLTAGRAFRLVQLGKLYEIDRLNITLSMAHPEAWAEAEEKRRTYWLAYCLDRFLNLSDEWPLSLHEEALCIYLPVSESDFQHTRPVVMGSLYEEIENSGHKMLPPFAETIVLITLCWHNVTLQRAAHGGKGFLNESIDPGKRYSRLYQLVQQRLMLISLPASAPELHDPMRLFTNMLANAAVIWFYDIMEILQGDFDDEMFLVPLYSAYEIVSLAKPLTRSSFFKAHAFSPMLLHLSAKFLNAHAEHLGTCASASDDKIQKVEDLKKALRVLQAGNTLAVSYLELLETHSDGMSRMSSAQANTMAEAPGLIEPSFFMDMATTF